MQAQQLFDLKTVMTFAVSAHMQKNEDYINYGTVTNKTIVQTHLGLLEDSRAVFVDHVTQECADIAEQMIQYYKGLTFKAMGNKIMILNKRFLVSLTVSWLIAVTLVLLLVYLKHTFVQ
jgi:hypothetical protein